MSQLKTHKNSLQANINSIILTSLFQGSSLLSQKDKLSFLHLDPNDRKDWTIAGTVLKLFYAFVWQDETLNLGDNIFTPEENAFEAALFPHINVFGNNLTTWDLYLEDVQHGASYPGSAWCNDLIPHAKWHAQTAASLGDVARLMDEVLRLTQGS